MADFNSEDLNQLSANLIAMNRSLVGLTRVIQTQSQKAGMSKPQQPQAQSQPKPANSQQKPTPGRPTSKPKSKDGVNVGGQDAKTKNALGGIVESSKSASKKMFDGAEKMSSSMGKLDGEFRSLSGMISMVKNMFVFTAVMKASIDVIGESITTYRTMIDNGQQFGGSMLKMQIAAAEARMPLEDLAKVVKNFGNVMAVTGVGGFTAMNRSLREGLTSFGMLGMTTNDINEFMGQFLETQRLSGNLSRMSQTQTVEAMKTMAMDATKVSELTGKSRTEIIKASIEAMKEISVRSEMFMLSGKAAEEMQKGMSKAATYLAGMPGEAGNILTKMLSETVGKGASILSSDVQSFSKVGLGGVQTLMDELGRKVKDGTVDDGDMEAFRSKIVSMGQANMASLKYMADFGNNEDAKKAIDVITQMSNLSQKQLKEMAEQKKITNFFLNLQDALQKVTGFFKEKFFKTFQSLTGNIDDITKMEGFKEFEKQVGLLADKLAKWFADFLKPENMKDLGERITKIVDNVMKFGSSLLSVMNALTPVFSGLASIIGVVASGLGLLTEYISGANIALMLLGTYLGVKLFPVLKSVYEWINKKTGGGGGPELKNGKGETDPNKLDRNRNRYSGSGSLLVEVTNLGKGGRGGLGGLDDDGPDRDKKGKRGKRGRGQRTRGRTAEQRRERRRGATPKAPEKSMIGSNVKPAMEIPKPGAPANTAAQSAKSVAKGVVGKGVGIGAALGVGADLYERAGGPAKESVGVLGDITGGAATGALIGSFVPVIGNLVGGLVGGALGGAASIYSRWDDLKEEYTGEGGVFHKKEEPKVSDASVGKQVDGYTKNTDDAKVDSLSPDNLGALTPNQKLYQEMLEAQKKTNAMLGKMTGSIDQGTELQRNGFVSVVESNKQMSTPSTLNYWGY